jgi:drug/metabolite transporter (DMT)-like permease
VTIPAGYAAAVSERPELAGLLGALVIAFSAILVRLADVTPATAAFFRCAYALPLLFVLARLERHRHGPRERRDRVLALIAGAIFAADLIFWNYSIKAVGAGLATVLGNVQVVLVALIAWAALGERPASRTLVSIPIALTGVVLISGVVGSGAYGDDPLLGVIYGLLTAISYAFFLLILRQAGSSERPPAGPLLDATLSGAVFCAIAGVAIGDIDWAPSAESQAWLVVLALSSQVLGWMLISTSLPRLPAALTSILLMLQPVTSVLLGAVLLDESPSAIQLSGVAIVLAAVGFATLGTRSREPLTESA